MFGLKRKFEKTNYSILFDAGLSNGIVNPDLLSNIKNLIIDKNYYSVHIEDIKAENIYFLNEKNLGGIKDMTRMPGAMFVVDPKNERIAILEARKLNIPIIGLVDTNCNPEDVDYPIPGNDDAIRAVKLITDVMANAIIEGRQGEILEAEAEMTEEAIAEEPTSIEEVVAAEETAE